MATIMAQTAQIERAHLTRHDVQRIFSEVFTESNPFCEKMVGYDVEDVPEDVLKSAFEFIETSNLVGMFEDHASLVLSTGMSNLGGIYHLPARDCPEYFHQPHLYLRLFPPNEGRKIFGGGYLMNSGLHNEYVARFDNIPMVFIKKV